MLRGALGKGVVHSSLPSLLPWSCHGRTGEDAMSYRQSWERNRMYTERVEATMCMRIARKWRVAISRLTGYSNLIVLGI